jgi:cell division protein FtsI/penicillin-binding protein 2
VNNSQQRRLWIIVIGLVFTTVIVVGRLVAFQVLQGESWASRARNEQMIIARPERGTIYDRNGAVLAANGAAYQVSVAPNLVSDPEELATSLAPIL